jgi:hypothetical protein
MADESGSGIRQTPITSNHVMTTIRRWTKTVAERESRYRLAHTGGIRRISARVA